VPIAPSYQRCDASGKPEGQKNVTATRTITPAWTKRRQPDWSSGAPVIDSTTPAHRLAPADAPRQVAQPVSVRRRSDALHQLAVLGQ
jgi:hypothetical protein